jgi:hypothetical protein
MPVELSSVMILLAMQSLAFCWRVLREIDGNEPHPYPWVPLPDNVNVLAMLAVLAFCLIGPFTATGHRVYPVLVMSKATFAAACVLIVAHPLVVASHYRVWGGRARGAGADSEQRVPYCTRSEAIVQLIALVCAAAVFVWVLQAANAPTVLLPTG